MYFYSVPPKPHDPRWGQAVAVSTDLNTWHRVRDIGLGICAADAIVIDGKVHLFYQTYSGSKTDSICHAVSRDGINFGVSKTPLFHPAGAWTCGLRSTPRPASSAISASSIRQLEIRR